MEARVQGVIYLNCNLKDDIYQHIQKDKLAQQIISDFRFNNACLNEDAESVDDNEPYELAGVYDNG